MWIGTTIVVLALAGFVYLNRSAPRPKAPLQASVAWFDSQAETPEPLAKAKRIGIEDVNRRRFYAAHTSRPSLRLAELRVNGRGLTVWREPPLDVEYANLTIQVAPADRELFLNECAPRDGVLTVKITLIDQPGSCLDPIIEPLRAALAGRQVDGGDYRLDSPNSASTKPEFILRKRLAVSPEQLLKGYASLGARLPDPLSGANDFSIPTATTMLDLPKGSSVSTIALGDFSTRLLSGVDDDTLQPNLRRLAALGYAAALADETWPLMINLA
jgi:hypothetical protein